MVVISLTLVYVQDLPETRTVRRSVLLLAFGATHIAWDLDPDSPLFLGG